jgi:hypothetical protein
MFTHSRIAELTPQLSGRPAGRVRTHAQSEPEHRLGSAADSDEAARL